MAVYFFVIKFPLISQYTDEYTTCYRAEIQGILREKKMLKSNWSHTGRVEKGSSVAKEGSEKNVKAQGKLKVDQDRTNGGRKDQKYREGKESIVGIYNVVWRKMCDQTGSHQFCPG